MPALDFGIEIAGKFKNHTGIGSSECRGFGKNARQVGFDRIVGRINKNKLGTFAADGLCVEVTSDRLCCRRCKFAAFEHGLLVLL